MNHITHSSLFSFTDTVRFFAGFFYRAYFNFFGGKDCKRLNRPVAC